MSDGRIGEEGRRLERNNCENAHKMDSSDLRGALGSPEVDEELRHLLRGMARR